MQIINVIVTTSGIVDTIDSFGITKNQSLDEAVEMAEELFKQKMIKFGGNFEDLDYSLEDGYYVGLYNIVVNLTWSEI